MRVQQVPNSPYFIHYDDEVFAVYPKAEKARNLSRNLRCKHSSAQ